MNDDLESEYAARFDDHAERWASEREDVRRQDLADSKENGPPTWFQASWTVPGVGRIYGPIYTERRKAVLSVPGFGSTASDLAPLIDESENYADMHERTHCNACNNAPHMLLCTTCGARGEPGVLPIER